MSWDRLDLFDFWRWFLAVACLIYTFVVTARWVWDWYVYLLQPGREMTLMRRYIMVHALRLRTRPFRLELAGIVFWSVVLAGLLWLDARLIVAS